LGFSTNSLDTTERKKNIILAMCECPLDFIFVGILMASSVYDTKKAVEKRAEAEKKSGHTERKEAGAQADEALELLHDLVESVGRGNAESCFRLPVENSTDHIELRKPSLGIPEQFSVRASYKLLLLKPQITFRSEADQDAIVLLAVEELVSKSFLVLDPSVQGDKKDDKEEEKAKSWQVLYRYVPRLHGRGVQLIQ
jgi:hypothetical protein